MPTWNQNHQRIEFTVPAVVGGAGGTGLVTVELMTPNVKIADVISLPSNAQPAGFPVSNCPGAGAQAVGLNSPISTQQLSAGDYAVAVKYENHPCPPAGNAQLMTPGNPTPRPDKTPTGGESYLYKFMEGTTVGATIVIIIEPGATGGPPGNRRGHDREGHPHKNE